MQKMPEEGTVVSPQYSGIESQHPNRFPAFAAVLFNVQCRFVFFPACGCVLSVDPVEFPGGNVHEKSGAGSHGGMHRSHQARCRVAVQATVLLCLSRGRGNVGCIRKVSGNFVSV